MGASFDVTPEVMWLQKSGRSHINKSIGKEFGIVPDSLLFLPCAQGPFLRDGFVRRGQRWQGLNTKASSLPPLPLAPVILTEYRFFCFLSLLKFLYCLSPRESLSLLA